MRSAWAAGCFIFSELKGRLMAGEKEEKAALRRKMLALRSAMESREREKLSREACRRLLEKIEPEATVAVYLAFGEELDLGDFISGRLASGAGRLAAPRWNRERGLYELAEVLPGALVEGHWGILEPSSAARRVPAAEIDVWLVPGLAFTPAGARLGYGGGHYDRFLALARKDARRIAVAFPCQILPTVPAEPHDLRVDEILPLGGAVSAPLGAKCE